MAADTADTNKLTRILDKLPHFRERAVLFGARHPELVAGDVVLQRGAQAVALDGVLGGAQCHGRAVGRSMVLNWLPRSRRHITG